MIINTGQDWLYELRPVVTQFLIRNDIKGSVDRKELKNHCKTSLNTAEIIDQLKSMISLGQVRQASGFWSHCVEKSIESFIEKESKMDDWNPYAIDVMPEATEFWFNHLECDPGKVSLAPMSVDGSVVTRAFPA